MPKTTGRDKKAKASSRAHGAISSKHRVAIDPPTYSGRGRVFRPSTRTDLALEAREAIEGEVKGVKVDEIHHNQILIHRVQVLNEEGAQALQKPIGTYVTIQAPAIRERNKELQEEASTCVAAELKRMLPQNDNFSTLVVGLGNWNATPDALGPKTVSRIMVTRHLKDYVPQELRGKLRTVSAISPGVLGITGIQTLDIIKSIVDRLKPDVVLAIDALSARKVQRLFTTIQLSDTGIQPGSGIGTDHQGITTETLGVPVIAAGIPTVLHAITIAEDTIKYLVEQLQGQTKFLDILKEMGQQDTQKLIREVLSPFVGNLMVTPKEIDMYITDASKLLAAGINAALQPSISMDEVNTYVQ